MKKKFTLKNNSYKNLGVIIFPTSGPGIIQLNNMCKILLLISNKLYVITGNDAYNALKDNNSINKVGINHKKAHNSLNRSFRFLNTQLKIAYHTLRLYKNVDMWIFMGGESLIIPIIATRIIEKK